MTMRPSAQQRRAPRADDEAWRIAEPKPSWKTAKPSRPNAGSGTPVELKRATAICSLGMPSSFATRDAAGDDDLPRGRDRDRRRAGAVGQRGHLVGIELLGRPAARRRVAQRDAGGAEQRVGQAGRQEAGERPLVARDPGGDDRAVGLHGHGAGALRRRARAEPVDPRAVARERRVGGAGRADARRQRALAARARAGRPRRRSARRARARPRRRARRARTDRSRGRRCRSPCRPCRPPPRAAPRRAPARPPARPRLPRRGRVMPAAAPTRTSRSSPAARARSPRSRRRCTAARRRRASR